MKKSNLPITEELDFSYLLTLMRPLHEVDEYAWLPELFTILGHDKLFELSKYAGGETITIPTLDSLLQSIEALQNFYDVYISKKTNILDIPATNINLVEKICEIYNAQEAEEKIA